MPRWGRCLQLPPHSSSALGGAGSWAGGMLLTLGPILNKQVCTLVRTLNMSYCTDWSKFRSFCCQLELKTIWSVGHGQGLETHAMCQPRHMELPCSRIPRGFLPRPFYGISPGGCCQKRFYSSRPNRCRCFPRCKKRVRLLSKLQNPSPSSAPAQESLPPFKSRL